MQLVECLNFIFQSNTCVTLKNSLEGLLVITDKFGCWYAVCAQGWQNFYKCGLYWATKLSSVLEQSILDLSAKLYKASP